MAKKRYNDNAQAEVLVVESETTESIIPDDGVIGEVEEFDTPMDEVTNPMDEVPEQDKVSSVAQVMDRAQNDPRVDTFVNPESVLLEDTTVYEPALIVEPSTDTNISSIIKRDDLRLLEKIDLLSKALSGTTGSVINSLVALYVLGSKTITRQPDTMNREQRAFVRQFIRLCNQSNTEEFNTAMKYINWVYKQLVDVTLLDKEELTLIRGVSPLDPTNSSIYTVGKDDIELVSFVYLITVLDVKATAKTPIEKAKKIDINKTTTNTLLTEEIVNKINNFYTI